MFNRIINLVYWLSQWEDSLFILLLMEQQNSRLKLSNKNTKVTVYYQRRLRKSPKMTRTGPQIYFIIRVLVTMVTVETK